MRSNLEDIELRMQFDPPTLSWQRVEEGEEEEEEETEAKKEILEAMKGLGRTRAATIAKLVGKDRSNTRKRLIELWEDGKCNRDLVDDEPVYSLKEENDSLQENQLPLEPQIS